jgi:hypothetical protein
MPHRRIHHWPALVGRTVEAKLGPVQQITGVVDDVMPDSSLLWLTSSDGTRRILEKWRGHEIFVYTQGPGTPTYAGFSTPASLESGSSPEPVGRQLTEAGVTR